MHGRIDFILDRITEDVTTADTRQELVCSVGRVEVSGAAKRELVRLAQGSGDLSGDRVLELLAAMWADHPEYRADFDAPVRRSWRSRWQASRRARFVTT